MDRKTAIWIKTMNAFSKYWGCHQLPERSFFFRGYQFPVCARCTGIIFGEISYFILSRIIHIRNRSFSVLCQLPLAIDGTIQYYSKYRSNNRRRFLTGFLFGYGVFATITEFKNSIIPLFTKKRTRSRGRSPFIIHSC